ncbi:MAG TPA: hypothetical protein H9869_08040 [Candidatus Ligilactobacillus excrementipullorum]|nr:hypothetical protein [Candidatus Ligilactobacillus excrementipullorum]
MDAKVFEKQLVSALNRISDEDVEKIREKIGVDMDYAIDQYGFTDLVKIPQQEKNGKEIITSENVSVLNKMLKEHSYDDENLVYQQSGLSVTFEVNEKETFFEKVGLDNNVECQILSINYQNIESNKVRQSKKLRRAA